MSEHSVEGGGDGWAGGAEVADGEVGVVGEGGARADHDGVVGAAEGVDLAAGFRSRDPAGFAGGGGGAAVERCGEFQGDEGQVLRDALQEPGVEAGGLGGEDAFGDGDPGGAEQDVALA